MCIEARKDPFSSNYKHCEDSFGERFVFWLYGDKCSTSCFFSYSGMCVCACVYLYFLLFIIDLIEKRYFENSVAGPQGHCRAKTFLLGLGLELGWS